MGTRKTMVSSKCWLLEVSQCLSKQHEDAEHVPTKTSERKWCLLQITNFSTGLVRSRFDLLISVTWELFSNIS